jgi:DNA repair protein RecO (recombination protein O)
MNMTRVSAQSGYILHTRSYRETSLLVDIFTPEYGRVSLVARGARKSSVKKNVSLQLFTTYHFSWTGRSELYTLTQAEYHSGAYLFSPYALCCGLYVNELLSRVLTREDPHAELYFAYQKFLQNLKSVQNIQISLRIFEKSLLENLGYGLFLDKIEAKEFYLFRVSEGFIHTKSRTPETFSGESLIALLNHSLEEKHLPEIKRLMRLALSFIIGEKPLRSRELFV